MIINSIFRRPDNTYICMQTKLEKKIYRKLWYNKNKARIRARQRAWAKQPGMREKLNEQQRRLYKRNKKKMRLYNKVYQQQYLSDPVNHEKHLARCRRYARKKYAERKALRNQS